MNVQKRNRSWYRVAAKLVSLCLLSSVSAVAQEGESLTYDPETGIYTIYYYNTYDQPTPVLQHAQFELPTRIDPNIKFELKESEQGSILYRYKLKSGMASKQDLVLMRLDANSAYPEGQMTPTGWHGSVNPDPASIGVVVGWSKLVRDGTGLKPGQSQGGFGAQSQDLAGVGMVETWGRVRRDLKPFPDMGPSSKTEIGRQYYDLIEKNDSVRRPAAVPKIPNPQPFDAAAVLTSLQKHVKEDIVGMKLIDPVFAAQLDRGLQAALDAAKRGNTAGLKGQIKELRLMLKGFGEPGEVDHSNAKDDIPEDQIKTKAWPHPISKLAARVIDFDLEYIEKRVRE